jgi:hypothetical protein
MKVVQVETFGENVRKAMKAGFTFTCAMCVKLHRARDRAGAEGWGVTCEATNCGGPGSGRNYPGYEGPLGDNHVAHCVFCGKPDPKQAVTTRADPNRILGVCKDHMKRLTKEWAIQQRKTEKAPLPRQPLVVKA